MSWWCVALSDLRRMNTPWIGRLPRMFWFSLCSNIIQSDKVNCFFFLLTRCLRVIMYHSKADVMSMLESAGFSRSNPYYIVPQGRVRVCLVQCQSDIQNARRYIVLPNAYGDLLTWIDHITHKRQRSRKTHVTQRSCRNTGLWAAETGKFEDYQRDR